MINIGRIVAGFTAAVLVQLFSIKMNPISYVKGAVITGLPGIAIQLVFIPSHICAIRAYMKKTSQSLN